MFAEFRDQISSLELIPSSGGAFEVYLDDKIIYSKLKTGVFPQADIIKEEINSDR